MNMISTLRQRVIQSGKAEITAEEFDQLQAEWITRSGAAEMVEAEREACAILGGLTAEFLRDGTPRRWADGQDVADAIRARSNVM